MKFPWDEETNKTEKLSKEEHDRMIRLMKETEEKMKQKYNS